jgi:hypothetical protein
MYIAQWSDPDVGNFTDDLAGCDSLLSLGYAYNGNIFDEKFSTYDVVPPAVGYVILQGPIVPGAVSDQAFFNFKRISGLKNLPMTSFGYLARGASIGGCFGYGCTIEWWNRLRGFLPQSDPENPERYRTVDTNKPTKFPLVGDPLSRRGDIDGIIIPPGDRVINLNTGPFTMALGDTQEVIIALVAGIGADRLFSVQVMKHYAKWARMVAKANFELPPEPESPPAEQPVPEFFRLSQNFPNPFNPGTEIRYDLPVKSHVTLTIFNVLGQVVVRLVDNVQPAGKYTIQWDGKSKSGQAVSSGVYFYKLKTEKFTQVRKMLLVR